MKTRESKISDENIEDETIQQMAKDKLKFTPLNETEAQMYQGVVNYKHIPGQGGFSDQNIRDAEEKLRDGGTYSVHHPEFLTGANISVCITDEFMEAVEQDETYELRFPDVENYTNEEMDYYNANWHEVGDVREWEKEGFGIRTYKTIKAKDLWNLINICATYSAEPGIFFHDNANKKQRYCLWSKSGRDESVFPSIYKNINRVWINDDRRIIQKSRQQILLNGN